jgi:hypothetical protein
MKKLTEEIKILEWEINYLNNMPFIRNNETKDLLQKKKVKLEKELNTLLRKKKINSITKLINK